MQDETAASRPDILVAALRWLQDRGISFRGPYSTSRGKLIQVEDQILRDFELIELYEKGELTPKGIWDYLAAQSPPHST